MECGETGPLSKYGDQDPESICKGCKFRGSKPEDIDEELQPLVTAAFELNGYKTAGARFEYPDGLAAWEWMVLTSLHRGKGKADGKKRPPKR